MGVGDVEAVPTPGSGSSDTYYVDTGMYDTDRYGSVYLLDAEQPAVVDTGIGADRDRVLAALDEVGIAREALAHVLVTHVHLDHAGGAGYLAEACPNATVRVHERGVRHLADPTRLVEGTKAAVGDAWEFYAEPRPVPDERIAGLTDGDAVDLGDRRIEAIGAPGHAPHQVVFHDDSGVLFTGDAAGLYVPPHDEITQTSPPPQFHLEKALDDARTIEERAPDTLAFGHFGPREFAPDLMEGYRRTLVEWVEAIRQRRTELDDDEAVVDHFADHADYADVWSERKARQETRLNVRGVLAYLDYVSEDDES